MKKRWVVALAAVLAAAPPARAAGVAPDRGARLTYDVGALVAVGARESLLDDAVLVGLTASYDLSPYLAVVAAVSGARSQGGDASQGERTLLQYDAGAQAQVRIAAGAETTLVPFLGAGLGARTRDDTEIGRGVDTDLTGYVAVGGRVEYGVGVVGLTARDLVAASGGPWLAHPGRARHDLSLLASFGVRF